MPKLIIEVDFDESELIDYGCVDLDLIKVVE